MRPITPAELRERIIAARESRGLSQAAAAKLAGVSQPLWARWEITGTNASPETMRRMAAAVGIEVDGPVFLPRKKPPKK